MGDACSDRAWRSGRAGDDAFPRTGHDLSLFMVAGEHSGDALGAKLMAALNQRRRGRVRYLGVGGAADGGARARLAVSARGCGRDGRRRRSLARLPQILQPRLRNGRRGRGRRAGCRRHHRQSGVHASDRAGASAGGARHSRSSTTCRPACGPGGRAARARCASYVDHVLALLPFEPDAHQRLGGPPCTLRRPSR